MVEYQAKKSVILDRILKDTNDQDDLSAHEYAADQELEEMLAKMEQDKVRDLKESMRQ